MDRGLYRGSLALGEVGGLVPDLIHDVIMLAYGQEVESTGLKGETDLTGGNVDLLVGTAVEVVEVGDLVGQLELVGCFLLVVLIDQHDVVTACLSVLHEGNDDTVAGLRLGVERYVLGSATGDARLGAARVVDLQGIQAGQHGTHLEDLSVDGSHVVVNVGLLAVGGDDGVVLGIAEARGPPGEVGHGLQTVGQACRGVVADLAAIGAAEVAALTDGLDVEGGIHIVLQADLAEEIQIIEHIGVAAVVGERVVIVAEGTVVLLPCLNDGVLHMALVVLKDPGSPVREEVQSGVDPCFHNGAAGGGIDPGLGGLVTDVDIRDDGVLLQLGHVVDDLLLGHAEKILPVHAHRIGYVEAPLGGQLEL